MQYDYIVKRLNELSDAKEKRSTKDYRMLKKYELFETITDDIITKRLQHRGSDKFYLCTDELFRCYSHGTLPIGHGARDITHNKTSELLC